MGMDVRGNSENLFRSSMFEWQAIMHALELSGFDVPLDWFNNDGEGFEEQEECDALADKLETFLSGWDGDLLVRESETGMRVDNEGRLVPAGTPDTKPAHETTRKRLEEFAKFLRMSDGFGIH